MEAKNIISFEFKKEDRIYRFELPYGAPLGEAYEVCSLVLDEIVRQIKEHAEKRRPQEPIEEEDEKEDVEEAE